MWQKRGNIIWAFHNLVEEYSCIFCLGDVLFKSCTLMMLSSSMSKVIKTQFMVHHLFSVLFLKLHGENFQFSPSSSNFICHVSWLPSSISRFHDSFLQHCFCRTSLRTLTSFVSAIISRYSNFSCLEQRITIFNVRVNYQGNLRAYSYILSQHVLNEV